MVCHRDDHVCMTCMPYDYLIDPGYDSKDHFSVDEDRLLGTHHNFILDGKIIDGVFQGAIGEQGFLVRYIDHFDEEMIDAEGHPTLKGYRAVHNNHQAACIEILRGNVELRLKHGAVKWLSYQEMQYAILKKQFQSMLVTESERERSAVSIQQDGSPGGSASHRPAESGA